MMLIERRTCRYLFSFICNIGVILMISYWLYKFMVEDRDVGVVDYELMEKAKDVEYPIPALCFQDPFIADKLQAINESQNLRKIMTLYKSYLKDDLFENNLANIPYENVTINLEDYFFSAHVILTNETRATQREVTFNHKNIFNGIYKQGKFYKCFAPEMDKNLFENARQVKFNYDKHKLLHDLIGGRLMYEISLGIHYPGQFLLNIGKPFVEKLQIHSAYTSVVDITSIELLKRRKKKNHDCLENWQSFDEMVLKKHIEIIGCKAPYHQVDNGFPVCDNGEDIKRSAYKFSEVRRIYYPKSCWRLSKLDYLKLNKRNNNRNKYWTFTIQYPEDVKIVTQSKEVDEHALIGNIGGYIGLFLGKYRVSSKTQGPNLHLFS